jgi:hypothetical protein
MIATTPSAAAFKAASGASDGLVTSRQQGSSGSGARR